MQNDELHLDPAQSLQFKALVEDLEEATIEDITQARDLVQQVYDKAKTTSDLHPASRILHHLMEFLEYYRDKKTPGRGPMPSPGHADDLQL